MPFLSSISCNALATVVLPAPLKPVRKITEGMALFTMQVRKLFKSKLVFTV
jgi:hypothetical protein